MELFLLCPNLVSRLCPHVPLCLFLSGNRSSKTFKPKKNIPEGSHQYELLKHAEATLGSGNLRMAVMLPDGEDLNEWVAVNSKTKLTLTPELSIIQRLIQSKKHSGP